MSTGLNKAYRAAMRGVFHGTRNPQLYLTNHLLDWPMMPNTWLGVASGIHRVNLVQHGNYVTVAPAGADRSTFSRAFNAYWCPNPEAAADIVILGAGANYFFTPVLSGCVLEINGLTVTHHDSLIVPGLAAYFGPLPVGGGAAAGHRIWPAANGDAVTFYSNVVGVRRAGAWEFYHQDYNPFDVAPLLAGRVGPV